MIQTKPEVDRRAVFLEVETCNRLKVLAAIRKQSMKELATNLINDLWAKAKL